jgi:hypothetical protein
MGKIGVLKGLLADKFEWKDHAQVGLPFDDCGTRLMRDD